MTVLLHHTRSIPDAMADRPFTTTEKRFRFAISAWLYAICVELLGPGPEYSAVEFKDA